MSLVRRLFKSAMRFTQRGEAKPRLLATLLVLSAGALTGLAIDEGYRSRAYDDGAQNQTIGFGSTLREDGTPVQAGDKTTPERALLQLYKHVNIRTEAPLRACLGEVRLYQHEWDAYVRLAYNVGTGKVCDSTIPGKLQAEQYEAACTTILDFNKVRDCSKPKVMNPKTGRWECPLVVWRGLTLRREREYRQCMGDTP